MPFAEFLKGRLKHEPESVDGILCWNFFDYLEPAAAQVLAARADEAAEPRRGGAGVFHDRRRARCAVFEVRHLDEDSLKQRPYSSGGKRQTALQNRDIIRMFEGLKVVGVVPAEDQRPRVSVSEACSTLVANVGNRRSYGSTGRCAADRFRLPRSLRRHDEGGHPRDLPGCDARRHHPRHSAA